MSVARRREREKEARREAILDAAVRVIDRDGVHGLRMDEIAREAELSKGTLYLYFPSKDALLAGVAVRRMSETHQEMQVTLAECPNGLERLLAFQRGMRQHMRDRPHVFRMMVEWLLQPDVDDQSEEFAEYRKRLQGMRKIVLDAIEEGRRDGSIRADLDVAKSGIHFWASTLGVVLMERVPHALAKRFGHPVDTAALGDAHEDVFRRAFAPDGDNT